MADKEQIINDEVDVSKCRFYKEGLCCLSYAFVENGYDCVECSEYQNCEYKQLAREKQKNEHLNKGYLELEKQLADEQAEKFQLQDTLRELEQENDNLLEQYKELDRYRKTLEEIEKFLNRTTCNICKPDSLEVCEECNVKRLKDIISKAKGEENAR